MASQSETQDFEASSLARRKRAKRGCRYQPPPGRGRRGRYGTNTPGPIRSMSTFIQSALSKSSGNAATASEGKRDSDVSGREGDRERGDSCSLVDNGKGSTAKKRGTSYKRTGESHSRSRKKLKLGIGEWDRMVEKVKWPGGGDEVINLDDQSDDDISSYSDNSSLSSCNSPEIGRREITDIETISEVSDEFGDHRTKEMSPCFSGSLLEREAGRRVGVAKGGLIEDSWRKRKTRLSKGEKCHLIQTSTPLLQQNLEDSIESSSDDEDTEPHPLQPHPPNLYSVTPSKSTRHISRGIPISMATLYAEADEPPEYESIESPPSSPETSHAYYSRTKVTPPTSPESSHTHHHRTKATEWLKYVSMESNQSNQFDQSGLNETMKTPVDSAKKSKSKKFVAGGLAEQLNRIVQREKSEITFWEHRSTRQQEDRETDTEGCLTVHLLSLTNSFSLLLAKAKILQGSPEPLTPPTISTALPSNSEDDVTIVFSQRCAKFLSLQVGHHVKLHPPWQCLYLPSISRRVLLCTHFCQVVGHAPPSPSSLASSTSPMPCRQMGVAGISTFLSPHDLPPFPTSTLSKSPTKGLLPTRLFGAESDHGSGSRETTVSGGENKMAAHNCGLLKGIEAGREGVVAELRGSVRRAFRRKISGEGEREMAEQRDRWSLLVEDADGMFFEVQLSSPLSSQWSKVVREGEGKLVHFNNLRIVRRTTARRNPELISLISSLVHHSRQQSPSKIKAPPTFCYILNSTVDSHVHLLDNDVSVEGEQSTAPVINDSSLGALASPGCAVDGGRVSLIGKIVHTHSEVCRVTSGDETTPTAPKSGFFLFVVTPYPLPSPLSQVPPSFSGDGQQLLRVYLKASFSIAGLKEEMLTPGRGVLLRDVLCQSGEEKDHPSLSMDACSLLLPTDWYTNQQVEVYPCPTLTDKELSKLNCVSMPRLPLLDHAHSTPNTLVSVNGVITGVDEESAFSWLVCECCGSDQLSDNCQTSSSLRCESCGVAVTSPDVHIELCVFLQCPTLEQYKVSVQLLQSTISRLLPISPSSVDQGFEVSSVLRKELSLDCCYIVDCYPEQVVGDESTLLLVVEELDSPTVAFTDP